VRSETKQTVIPHRENMLGELVTLSEMTELVTILPSRMNVTRNSDNSLILKKKTTIITQFPLVTLG